MRKRLKDRGWITDMTLTEARNRISEITVDSFGTPTERQLEFYTAKGFLEGHKAALELVREHIFDACGDDASVCADCSDNMLFIDKLLEAQK